MSALADLQTRVEEIVSRVDANFGVSILHIESGQTLNISADVPVPLASVVKIPVLVEAFHQLREWRFQLDDRWTLEHSHKALGSGILTQFDDGLTPTVRDLLTLMIIISDNTATDILIERLGVQAIDDFMHQLGLSQTHVAHTLNEIFADMLPTPDPDQERYELARWEAEHGVRRDGFSYSLGEDNNVGTPRELTQLLAMIFKAEILDRDACDQMLEILLKQQLNDRLPRFLPAGTPVAHKTGTFSGVRNDAGIIYAGENSHVVVTVLSTWDHGACRGDPVAEWARAIELDTAIGQIGLAAYQAFC